MSTKMANNISESRNDQWRDELRRSMTAKERMGIARVKMPELKLNTALLATRKLIWV